MKNRFLCFVLVLVAGIANATTIYISPTGSDAKSGTQAAPFKTLFKATSVAQNGDVIHVNAGTYTESQSTSLPAVVSIEGVGNTSIIRASFSTVWQAILYCNSAEGTNGSVGQTTLVAGTKAITISGLTNAGTTNTSDTSVLNYFIIN